MRSLDDELEFYELVELDAEGEADDQTFDDMMSSTSLINISTNHNTAAMCHVMGKSQRHEHGDPDGDASASFLLANWSATGTSNTAQTLPFSALRPGGYGF